MIRILNQNETLPNHANFESQFFQKLVKKRLEVDNKVLYRKFFDDTGKIKCKQIVLPPKLSAKLSSRYTTTLYKATPAVAKCYTNSAKDTTHLT